MKLLTKARLALRGDVVLGDVFAELAGVHGSRRLVEEHGGGLRIDYRQAAKRVARWAGGIAHVTQPGDRVVLHTRNGYEQLLLCAAASRAGCICVPVNDQMRDEEIRQVVADSEASLVVHNPAQVDGAEPLEVGAAVSPDEIAALFYTSGSTGRPKGVELTHRSLLAQMLMGTLWPAQLRHDEAVVSLPVAHIMGFATLMGFACAGISTWMVPHFRPVDVLDAIETRRASIFVGVPAMYRMLLEAGADDRDLSSVRVWCSGADTMPAELARHFKQLGASVTLPFGHSLGEAAFVEGYGMVEVGGGVLAKVSPPMVGMGLGASLGLPLTNYSLRVVDDADQPVAAGTAGELQIRGPGMLRGYWNAPDASAEVLTDDGWLRTGDLVRRGVLGSVIFVGRQKDVIKHGGYSVYAVEVQAALEEHPEVAEAAVCALADERLGEVPGAAVRLVDGATLDTSTLAEWASGRLADYKVPRRFVVVEDLPRTGTRKLARTELAELFDA